MKQASKHVCAIRTQVDDAQVEALLVWLCEALSLLLFLDLAHELLRLLVLRGHDVAHTEIGCSESSKKYEWHMESV
jgi:hypothetical protein